MPRRTTRRAASTSRRGPNAGGRRCEAQARRSLPARRRAGARTTAARAEAARPHAPAASSARVARAASPPTRPRRRVAAGAQRSTCRSISVAGSSSQPDPRRVRHVRLRHRVRRRRRRPAARRDLLQGHDAQAADRQPHPARDRDAGRDAELDRAPEPGRRRGLEKYAGTWAGWKVPVIVNVAGESVEDYVEVARRLDGVPGVAGIELNISCPNVGKGGLQFAIDAERRARSPRRSVGRPTCRCWSSCRRTSPTSGRSPGRSRTRAPTR